MDVTGARGLDRVASGPVVGLVVGMLALAPSRARAEEPAPDPTWRTPWTVSVSGGGLQGWSTALCVTPAESSTVGACSDETYAWTAFAADVAVPFTVARSSDGRRSFEVGPQASLVLFTGDGLFVKEAIHASPTLQYGAGAVAGLRFRPYPPPAPGGRASFEHGFRLGALFGPDFVGLNVSMSAEAWAAWSLAPRWRPPAATGLPPAPTPVRRTAVVLGPYVRAWLRHLGSSEGTGSAVEIGLRVDLRREHAVPQPPG